MTITDKLYGSFKVEEPVIIELLESAAIKRLEGISQHGYASQARPYNFSRLEHSLGVFLLLRKYGASLDEQIAGLIHDAAHAVFSHTIDYVGGRQSGGRQDHQDKIQAGYIKRTDIPAVLAKHGFDLAHILDDNNFPLKESPLPELCADRLDYSLRLARLWEKLDDSSLAKLLDNLETKNGKWLFKDQETAKQYAELFLFLNQNYYAGLSGAAMHESVSRYLNHALKQGYISEDDLYATEPEILSRLASFHGQDRVLEELFSRMNELGRYRHDPEKGEEEIVLKSRVVDPSFLGDSGHTIRLSEAWPRWKEVVAKELAPKSYRLYFA